MSTHVSAADQASVSLVTPYGETLVDLRVHGEERQALRSLSRRLPPLTISERSVCDLELLATGGFSPLRGFLGSADHARVLDEIRLADGTLWPMPITLPVPADAPVALDAEVALRTQRGEILAVLTVRELFPWDRAREARALLGRYDEAHPLVAEMAGWGGVLASGELRVIDLPSRWDFTRHRLTPGRARG